MASRKIIYIFNPISGTKGKDALIKKIEKATQPKDLHFESFISDPGGNYEQLREKIKQEKFTDVIIVGGDGTVNQVTNALRSCNVKFGIIPAGSGNGLAYAAGIPKNVTRAIQMVFDETAKKTDAFMVNNHYGCMLSGLGFDAAVAHKFAEHPKRGLKTYVQETLLHFFAASTYRFKIIMNDHSFDTDAYFVSIANSNQFGNNVTIAPKAKLNDGLLDIVIVQKMHKARLAFAVLKQISGSNNLQLFTKTNSEKAVLYFQSAALSIKNFDCAPFHIDGDPAETAEYFEIEIIEKAFRLLQP